MIGMLQGSIHEHKKGSVLVKTTGGVGYVVFVSSKDKEALLKQKKCSLYTHTVFRRDSIELFGFRAAEEQSCFLLLISVSGIGPKKAMVILEKLPTSVLFKVIQSKDSETLKSYGISERDAQKIIIELYKKNEIEESHTGTQPDLIIALLTLGYSRKEIQPILKTINPEDTLERQIQVALRNL